MLACGSFAAGALDLASSVPRLPVAAFDAAEGGGVVGADEVHGVKHETVPPFEVGEVAGLLFAEAVETRAHGFLVGVAHGCLQLAVVDEEICRVAELVSSIEQGAGDFHEGIEKAAWVASGALGMLGFFEDF